jgi:prepilin-type processing-associated H-X9-DG protein
MAPEPLDKSQVNPIERNERFSSGAKRPRPATPALAFTLLELLVIVSVLALLLSMLIPTMSKSGLNSRAFQCLNNNRQLCNAWRLYADDNRDVIVYSSDDGTGISNPLNQYAWTSSHMDFNPNNRGNWDTNYDITVRLLWPYTGRNASIYRCPSDPTYIRVAGVPRPRVRGMSINFFLGGFAGTTGGSPQLNAFRLFLRTTDLTEPGSGKTFVFTDERPDRINWGGYGADMAGYPNQPSLYEFDEDIPGMYHNGGGSFSFADGRAEIHRWADPRTTPPYDPPMYLTIIPVPNDPDVAWLQSHSTSLK